MRPAIYKHKYRRFFPFKRSLKRLSNKFLPKLNNFKRLRQFRKVKFLNKRNYFLFFKKNLTNILFTELLLCRHVFSFFTFKHYLSFTSQYYSDTFLHQNAVFDQFFITSPSIYLFTRGVVSRDTGSILLTNTIQKQNSTFSLLKSKQLAPNFNQ